LVLFGGVLDETKKRFVFEIMGLHLVDDRLTFYIKPADGLSLPGILKWLKQTFAMRYNVLAGRTGHIWGDRYVSLILEGEPPVGVEEEYGRGREAGGEPLVKIEKRVRPRSVEIVMVNGFSPIFFPVSTSSPP
jgi:hypothetical protein